jgi:hypothetical protein
MTDAQHTAALHLELTTGLRRLTSWSWTAADWRRVLTRVPPKDARLLVLQYLWGMTRDQIRERVGDESRSHGHVHQHLKLPLRRLRAMFARSGPLADLLPGPTGRAAARGVKSVPDRDGGQAREGE